MRALERAAAADITVGDSELAGRALTAGPDCIVGAGRRGRQPRELREVRPAGIEPAACGLKDRCSLAPLREPLTTELRARVALPSH
jgi:hypothetical protein